MSIDADFGCSRPVLVAVMAIFLVLWANVGRAETDPRLQLVTAVAAKEKALDSGRVQDWERTLELFQQLHAENATAATAYEIGVAAGQLVRDDIAFEAYENAIELGLSGEALVKAQRFIEAHASRLSRLHLTCPDGSQVFVRGTLRGQTPLRAPLVVLPGSAEIECRTTSDESLRGTVALSEGRQHVSSLNVTETSSPQNVAVDHGLYPIGQLDATTSPSRPEHKEPPKGTSASSSRTSSATSTNRAAWVLVGAGASLAVIGTLYAGIADSRMSNSIAALANACAEQVDGPDSCKHAERGQQAAAQSYADSIATWRNVRTISLVSAGVGAAAILGSLAVLVGVSRPEATTASVPEIRFSRQQVTVAYGYAF